MLRDVSRLVGRAVREGRPRLQRPDAVRVLRRSAPHGLGERQDRAQGVRLQVAAARVPHQREAASHVVMHDPSFK
jgi:hypothetical protein